MIDLNDYAKVIEGEKWVPFSKAVEALNELANHMAEAPFRTVFGHRFAWFSL